MAPEFSLSLPLGPTVQVLHPGDVCGGTRGDRLETLLGSCVAIMLTDPRRTVGAMCHFVHRGDGRDAHHAEPAFDALCQVLRGYGVQPSLCEAHLAGGGNMFPGSGLGGDVGAANAEYALALMAHYGLQLRTQSLGGPTYRKVAWTIGAAAPEVKCVGLDAGTSFL